MSGIRALNDTPYDSFLCIDGGWRHLQVNVVLLCGFSQRLYVILITLYLFVGVDMVLLVQ